MNKFRKVAITLALASTAAVHGLSMAHPEHDAPAPVEQTAEVKASLTGSGANTKVIFTKGTEQVSTAGASGTVKYGTFCRRCSLVLVGHGVRR